MFSGGGSSGTFLALLSLLLGPFVCLFVCFLQHCFFLFCFLFSLTFRCINLCVLLFSFISDILFVQGREVLSVAGLRLTVNIITIIAITMDDQRRRAEYGGVTPPHRAPRLPPPLPRTQSPIHTHTSRRHYGKYQMFVKTESLSSLLSLLVKTRLHYHRCCPGKTLWRTWRCPLHPTWKCMVFIIINVVQGRCSKNVYPTPSSANSSCS